MSVEEVKATPETVENSSEEAQGEFTIQRVYLKDLSFEAPNSPAAFLEEWKPEVNMDLHTDAPSLDDDNYDVCLTVTVTVKLGDKVAFLVEAKQAAIFTIKGLPEEQMRHTLGAYCPSILYPYAREVISDAIVRGGFPPLYLQHVNFDMLLAEHDGQLPN